MKCWCMVWAIAGALWLAAARGETPDQYRVAPVSPPAAVKPRPARPMFAPESAATARPLEAHERDERRFLKDAAASSRFQVDAARLALARSGSAGVRALATTVSDEHVFAANELLRLLHQRGLAPPMLENAQRRALARLARSQGARFDREYLAVVIAAAREEAALYDKANSAVQDPALGNWIAQWLPVLRAQIQDAERLGADAPAARQSPSTRHARPAAKGARRGVSGSNTR